LVYVGVCFVLPLTVESLPFMLWRWQLQDEGLFMSLVIHYWIGDVQDSQDVSISHNANYNF